MSSNQEEKIQNTEREEDLDAVKFVERKRWLFLGLPWTFTKYTITPSTITIDQGLLKTVEDDCYMYKIQDVRLTTSFMERIFKLGTIVCYTGDVTNKELSLVHIKHAKEVKSYLLKASEAARIRRRTLNTLDIGAGSEMDDMLND
ncbi:MAG: PH domain-containing protein [Lachnospiraceae bacterium]|nr:PH domain-containing protein [Lachnospiraceae bacterium]